MSNTEPTVARYDTEIVSDPTVPAVRISRNFDATPAQLMRAHTDPAVLVQWLGPYGLEMEIDRWDCRTGGEYRYTHSMGGETYGFHGSFHEVGEARIVQTFTFEGYPDGVALETLTITDLGDGRSRLDVCSLVDSFEGRDMMVASGMETGIIQGYERLDTWLATA